MTLLSNLGNLIFRLTNSGALSKSLNGLLCTPPGWLCDSKSHSQFPPARSVTRRFMDSSEESSLDSKKVLILY